MSFKFSKPCLDLNRIYGEGQTVYDGLSFRVPSIHPVYSRGVTIRDLSYEVWSPNSEKVDYYPGTPAEKEQLQSYYPSVNYFDGCLGPQDWSLHPQHFYPKSPWLGFCRCPQYKLSDWRSADPELVPLPLVWVPSLSNPEKGSLDQDYLSSLTN